MKDTSTTASIQRHAARPDAIAQLGGDELHARVAELRWFHTIDLGGGVVTPGHDATIAKVRRVRLPERLDGLSVLDIGAWDGAFSFECERRGAAHVVAVDPACWREPAWGERGWGTKRPFELARAALGSAVEDRDIDLLDIAPATIGEFDVVLLLGVLYHLPDPWPYLARAASVCRGLLIVETHADMLDCRRPAAAYYPGAEIEGDPSNWWGPNAPLLAAKLADAGFSRVRTHSERRAARLARSALRRLRGERFPRQAGRLVAHAWRA